MNSHGRRGRWEVNSKTIVVAASYFTLCFFSLHVAAQEREPATTRNAVSPFVDPTTVDPAIPSPETIIGHPVGDRAVRYDDLIRYLKALDEASPLVTMTPYAESHEGRSLYYLTITSQTNHGRLAAIQADNAKLADPRKLKNAEEANTIIEKMPGVAWLSYNIHGDELSSTDAAVQVAYQLAAGIDETTKRLREELVIHIDPLMNPDGRERYLVQLENLTGKVPNFDYQSMQHNGLWSAGRGNHYLFDLNRDWLMQVHPETRGRTAVIQSWNPHLVVDSHEMGGLDTYLFDPPREPFNVNLSESNMQWRRRFSADQAKAFDRFGWSYYTQEWYEEWYPGYTNAWANLLGAVGILYEQAAVNSAALKQHSGTILTYREAVHHHVVSSLANLESLRVNRKDILRDFHADRRWAVSDEGPHLETFIVSPSHDRSRFNRLLDLLNRQGIENTMSEAAFTVPKATDIWGGIVENQSFPAGTLLVRSQQPHRRLIHAILGFDPHMSDSFLLEERKEIESYRESRIYDVTAWNLPMAYGLEAYWSDNVGAVAARSATPSRTFATPALVEKPAGYGYLIDGASADIHRALAILLAEDCKPRVASKPFTVGGRDYAPGAILLRKNENPDKLAAIVIGLVPDLNVEISRVDTALSEKGPDLGGQRFHLLYPPRIAIATQWPVSTTSFGWTWYMVDVRLGIPTSPINIQALGQIDLRRYNVIVLPDSGEAGTLGAVLNKDAVGRLRAWVESGGTLIAFGASAAFLAGKDVGLSQVRLKQDVLGELDVYAEAVKREKEAREVKVDSSKVWAPPTTMPATTQPAAKSEPPTQVGGVAEPATPATTQPAQVIADKKDEKPDVETLKRTDEWQRRFSTQGAIVTGVLNPEHWLCFGLDDRLPVLLAGENAFMSKQPVATPVRLADENRLSLSGLLWPEARQRLADTAYATVESVGQGQIILFATDPFFRGYFEGSGRLLQNALLLGPGMGTSQPVPW